VISQCRTGSTKPGASVAALRSIQTRIVGVVSSSSSSLSVEHFGEPGLGHPPMGLRADFAHEHSFAGGPAFQHRDQTVEHAARARLVPAVGLTELLGSAWPRR
jgi:hypothetical protein